MADEFWLACTALAIAPATGWVISALRRKRGGVDIIAVLSTRGQPARRVSIWPGALIAVMLASGRALESSAARRAAHELHALLKRAPRFARRRTGSQVTVVP
nr:hypothetical protein [Mycobacterium tilburgii]